MGNIAGKRAAARYSVRGAAAELRRSYDKRITPPIISNIENGIVNPTPDCLKEMATLFNCETSDLLTPDEVDYGITEEKPKSKDAIRAKRNREGRKNFSVLIPIEYFDGLDEMIDDCGYKSREQWMIGHIMELRDEKRKKSNERNWK